MSDKKYDSLKQAAENYKCGDDLKPYVQYDRMDILGSAINPEYSVSSFDDERGGGDGKMKWIDIATSLPPLGASCVVEYEKEIYTIHKCCVFDIDEDGVIGFRYFREPELDEEYLIDIKSITRFIIMDE